MRMVLIFVALLAAAPAARAQHAKVALVIGNGAYRAVPQLANPPNDARAVAAALTRLGFRTNLVLDADQAKMQAAVRRLAEAAKGADAAVLFYAGHAAVVDGHNLLVPVSASAGQQAELTRQSLGFDDVTTALEGRAQTTMIVLDSCRDSPFVDEGPAAPARGVSRSLARGGSGLASVSSGAGMLIAFATAPGNVALDGSGAHSPFTAALLRHIEETGVEVRQMLGEVRADVRRATAGAQIPWDNSSLEGKFYLHDAAAVGPTALTAEAAKAIDIRLPRAIQTLAFTRPPGTAAGFVGSWSSDSVGWGGSGRTAMVIVLGIDEAAGTADVVVAWGPPSEHSIDPQRAAGFRHETDLYRNGRIERPAAGGGRREFFTLLSDTELQGTEILSPTSRLPNHQFFIRLHRVE